MDATPIERPPSLADRVYDALCEHIVSGKLQPGERIVLEQLAQQFGVSLTPVRDASIRLVRDGLATLTPSGRMQVVPLTASYVNDVYDVRIALEGVAASHAASRIPDEILAELVRRFEKLTATPARAGRRELREANRLLHRIIHEVSTNPILSKELQSLRLHADYILGYVFREHDTRYDVSLEEHRELLNALVTRDPEMARAAMEVHMRRVRDRIVALLETQETAPADTAAQGARVTTTVAGES